jgi:hypothetical protein
MSLVISNKGFIMTTTVSLLRDALVAQQNGKDISREAGAGIWGNYVRSVMSFAGQPVMCDGNAFEAKHNAVIEELNMIKELSKAEMNSLRSAKCVIKKVVEAGKPTTVWQYEADGTVRRDDYGFMQPVGKSELSDTKTDLQRMLAAIATMQKKIDSEACELGGTEAAEVAKALQTLTANVWQYGANVSGEDAAQFMIDNAV